MIDGRLAAVLLAGLTTIGTADARPQVVGRPREVRQIYWELLKSTEVLVELVPEDAAGRKPLVSLTFRAHFPGVAKRNPYNGLPEWPTGRPARMTLTAQALPLVLIRELSLRISLDGAATDLTGPGSRYRNVPCLVAGDGCAPNGVEAEIDATLLRSFVDARTITGSALGFPVRLSADDQAAVREFGARAHVFQP